MPKTLHDRKTIIILGILATMVALVYFVDQKRLITWLVIPFLMLALIFTFARLWQGPSLPDRIAALDLLSSLGIGIIAVYAINTEQPVLMDIAAVIAMVSFLGTVAFAYYIQRKHKERKPIND